MFLTLLQSLQTFPSLWLGWLINYPNNAICFKVNDPSKGIRDLFYKVRNVTTKREGKINSEMTAFVLNCDFFFLDWLKLCHLTHGYSRYERWASVYWIKSSVETVHQGQSFKQWEMKEISVSCNFAQKIKWDLL